MFGRALMVGVRRSTLDLLFESWDRHIYSTKAEDIRILLNSECPFDMSLMVLRLAISL